MFVTIIVVTLSVTAVAFIYIKPCDNCGRLFCFGTCVIWYDENGVKIDDPNSISPNTHKTNQKSTRLVETERANQSYLEGLVFIGDSRTIGLQAHANLDSQRVFAEDGLNHEAALTKKVVKLQEYKSISIPDAVRITVPDIMVVNFGINGIAWMSVEKFMEGYELLVDELIANSPESIIVIEAIMPVSYEYTLTDGGVTNEKIDQANDALYNMARRRGLYYLATNEALKDDENNLKSGFHSGDGLHYSKAAYDVIVDYILGHEIKKK